MATTVPHTDDECEAASAFVSLCSSLKRARSEDDEVSLPLKKRPSLHIVSSDSESDTESSCESETGWDSSSQSEKCSTSASSSDNKLLPSPYFYYRDYSTEKDEDPLTPLTPPARVPNFPAKMHAILSRRDLENVITWMPHGRSWKILKKCEFETRVLPVYFDHSKLSSFVRQANGWGFRRITKGADRNTYYHPRFLRGLPHLCKNMKRPGIAKKVTANPAHEPDFAKISQEHPIGEATSNDESILLTSCTLKSGPKTRMPVHLGISPNQPPTAETKMTSPLATATPPSPVSPSPKPVVSGPMPVPALNNSVIVAAFQQAAAIQKAAAQQSQAQMLNQTFSNTLFTSIQQNPNTSSFAAGFAAATALQKALLAQQQPHQAALPSFVLRR